LLLNPPEDDHHDDDDKQQAKNARAGVTIAITVSAKAPTEAAEQKNNQQGDKDYSKE
tara:strand:- start:7655 stop:7825 length:171 start_codon:yes stop_codon:yes gene_type:complete